MKLTKLQLKEIIKEVIAEEQKFYARKPDGSKVSIFTNKDKTVDKIRPSNLAVLNEFFAVSKSSPTRSVTRFSIKFIIFNYYKFIIFNWTTSHIFIA